MLKNSNSRKCIDSNHNLEKPGFINSSKSKGVFMPVKMDSKLLIWFSYFKQQSSESKRLHSSYESKQAGSLSVISLHETQIAIK